MCLTHSWPQHWLLFSLRIFEPSQKHRLIYILMFISIRQTIYISWSWTCSLVSSYPLVLCTFTPRFTTLIPFTSFHLFHPFHPPLTHFSAPSRPIWCPSPVVNQSPVCYQLLTSCARWALSPHLTPSPQCSFAWKSRNGYNLTGNLCVRISLLETYWRFPLHFPWISLLGNSRILAVKTGEWSEMWWMEYSLHQKKVYTCCKAKYSKSRGLEKN